MISQYVTGMCRTQSVFSLILYMINCIYISRIICRIFPFNSKNLGLLGKTRCTHNTTVAVRLQNSAKPKYACCVASYFSKNWLAKMIMLKIIMLRKFHKLKVELGRCSHSEQQQSYSLDVQKIERKTSKTFGKRNICSSRHSFSVVFNSASVTTTNSASF